MCLAFLSLFRSKNKVAPAPLPACPYSQKLLSHARVQMEKEHALTRRTISTQTTESVLQAIKRSQTPKWLSYDVDINGNIVERGLKRQCPRKLARDPKLPVLTKEMLLEKQVEADMKLVSSPKQKWTSVNTNNEKGEEEMEREREQMAAKLAEKQSRALENRKLQIEKRIEKARRSNEAKLLNSTEEDATKSMKTAKIMEKQSRAAEKRQRQLELIKSKAHTSSRITVVEANCLVKAQYTEHEIQRRNDCAKANRDRTVRRIVQKQRLRESYAQKVRARVAKQQEEDLAVNSLSGEIEVDAEYFASSSELNDEQIW